MTKRKDKSPDMDHLIKTNIIQNADSLVEKCKTGPTIENTDLLKSRIDLIKELFSPSE